jgi:hypothetical protein
LLTADSGQKLGQPLAVPVERAASLAVHGYNRSFYAPHI